MRTQSLNNLARNDITGSENFRILEFTNVGKLLKTNSKNIFPLCRREIGEGQKGLLYFHLVFFFFFFGGSNFKRSVWSGK